MINPKNKYQGGGKKPPFLKRGRPVSRQVKVDMKG
jgi:hypothetical protein